MHDDDAAEISRSQRKRDVEALQDVGKELVALSPARLAQLDLPPPLLEAVVAAKGISKFGALRRQLQYIGRLMREVDAGPIREQLDLWRGGSATRERRPRPRRRREFGR